MSINSSRAIGVIQILLSGICFGFIGILAKGAYEKGLEPGEVLSLRFSVASLLLLGFLSVTSFRRLVLTPKHLLWSFLLGTTGYAVFSFCFFKALSGLSASLTVLLLYLYPVMVPIGGWIFLGERIPRDRFIALPIAIIGLVILVWGDFQVRYPLYLIFGIASAVFYSAYILCSRRFLAEADTLASTAYIQLSGGMILSAMHWKDFDRLMFAIAEAWPWILGLAIICSIAAMSLFLAGLKRLQSWETSILSISEPVTTIFLASMLLNEHMTQTQVIGATLVLSALITVSLPSRMTFSSNGLRDRPKRENY